MPRRATKWHTRAVAGMSLAVKEIRALKRGVAVIETLCRLGACSLADLHRATDLPKSTLRRILATFEQANVIHCSLADGLYRSNVQIPSASEVSTSPFVGRIVRAAIPVLEQLAMKVAWPSDVLMRDGTRMRIVETNRALTPLLVNRSEIDDQVDMRHSAVGRAYLAFCPQTERDEILAEIFGANDPRAVDAMLAILKETRDRGYGERDTAFTGGTDRYPLLTDKLYAIAVPVIVQGRVICCVNMLWPRAAAPNVGDKATMAKLLKTYADQIANNYQQMAYGSEFVGHGHSVETPV
jgi:IclR family mhp operon transcriptional activator